MDFERPVYIEYATLVFNCVGQNMEKQPLLVYFMLAYVSICHFNSRPTSHYD